MSKKVKIKKSQPKSAILNITSESFTYHPHVVPKLIHFFSESPFNAFINSFNNRDQTAHVSALFEPPATLFCSLFTSCFSMIAHFAQQCFC